MTELEIDWALADHNAAQAQQEHHLVANAARALVQAPDPTAWQDCLYYVGQAVPPARAAALAGLDWRKVKAWLKHDPDAAARLEQTKAQTTAKLVAVVWQEATVNENWRAALSLLRHTDAHFDPAPRKAKLVVQNNTKIDAQTAQVLATSSSDDLRKVLGLG